jgi:hypothetical protein
LYKFEENENGDFVKTTYKIDNLTLNYSDVGNVILSESSPSLSVDKIVIDWQIV